MNLSELVNALMSICFVSLIIMCIVVVVFTIKYMLVTGNEHNSPFEKYSLKKKGVLLTFEIKFNEEDDRDYSEIAKEIEDAIVVVNDKRGHILLSKIRRALTDMDLK